jgi:RNA recognition motif-containing protein
MGCGVVEYSTREIALEAVAIMNETELKGRMIRCREDRVPGEDEIPAEDTSEQKGPSDAPVGAPVPRVRPPRAETAARKVNNGVAEPNKVFVTSLTWDTTEDDLAEYFGTVGPVSTATILSTGKGRSMGSGIVEFADSTSVAEAISRLSNIDFKGRVIVVREYFQ